jgi:dipeptidyl-peptidase-4
MVNSAKQPSFSSAGSADSITPKSGLDPLRDQLESFPALYARTHRFSIGVPRNLQFADFDRRLLYLRSANGEEPTLGLWRLDLETGEESLLASPELIHPDANTTELPPAERARRERARESASGIVSYSLDRSGRRACFALGGELFVVDTAGGDINALEVAGPVFDPRLSPDGRFVAYVSAGSSSSEPDLENSLRLVEVDAPGSDRPLAADPDPLIGFGRAEFVAAEEMQRSRGFWWSPDSDRLLVARVDENLVSEWWVNDPAHPDRPPTSFRYPAAGSVNAGVNLLVVDLDGTRRKVNWTDAHHYEYLANVVWSSGRPPLVVRQTRDQLEVSIAEVDLDSLTLKPIRTIQEDTWVELIPSSPTWCRRGLLTIEDLVPLHQPGVPDAHPGCRALLLNGRAMTDDRINVKSIVGVIGDHAIISAWTEPSESHLFLVPLDGDDTGQTGRPAGRPGDEVEQLAGVPDPIALTTNPGVYQSVLGRGDGTDEFELFGGVVEDDVAGTGSSPGGLFDHEADDDPLFGRRMVVMAARPASDGTEVAVRAFDRNHTLGPPTAFVEDLSLRPPIKATPLFMKLGADRLESALFLPTDFTGDRMLPVLLDPYGGPHAQRVVKAHSPHLVSQWFADHGFVVLVTDGRGTPGRGPRWERRVWGDLAGPVLEDQLAALDAAAAEFEFLDLNRVAIRGWSFGGYLAALAVLRRPDRFHAAIAGAPVTDWRLYDTHYTERYLGHPGEFPRHYEATDLTAEAEALQRPLMLIHGLVDDNVVAAHTLRLSTALLAAGRPHQVLPLSGVTHMTPQSAVAENLLRLQLRFLQDSLPEPVGNGPDSFDPLTLSIS